MPASRRSSAGGSAAASRSADLPRPASTPPTFSVGLNHFLFLERLYRTELLFDENDEKNAREISKDRGGNGRAA